MGDHVRHSVLCDGRCTFLRLVGWSLSEAMLLIMVIGVEVLRDTPRAITVFVAILFCRGEFRPSVLSISSLLLLVTFLDFHDCPGYLVYQMRSQMVENRLRMLS